MPANKTPYNSCFLLLCCEELWCLPLGSSGKGAPSILPNLSVIMVLWGTSVTVPQGGTASSAASMQKARDSQDSASGAQQVLDDKRIRTKTWLDLDHSVNLICQLQDVDKLKALILQSYDPSKSLALTCTTSAQRSLGCAYATCLFSRTGFFFLCVTHWHPAKYGSMRVTCCTFTSVH